MKPHRRALVTGGDRGIGRGIAETLARDGCDVAIFYKGSAEDGQATVAAIKSHGREAWACVGDVAETAQVNTAVERLAAEWGGVDILVNNAGIVDDAVLWKMTDTQWRDVLDINLMGMFRFCRAVVPLMRKREWGAIVQIASINGMRGKFGQTNYSAAKAGVIGLTKALAKEVARFNITVNAVAPGLIRTAILDSMSDQAKTEAIGEILLGRPGTVEDVAEAVGFLCSERARFVTGETLRVDGGQYI